MKRPDIVDIDAAIRFYYGTGYIGSKEMKEIFGRISSSTVSDLKKAVRSEEIDRGIPVVVSRKVNTKIAYEVWSIDIDELIQSRERLKKLGL